ncbi:MAG: hypothetical protein U1C74_13745 [Phenylobacterium sp.]|nr:hypothetical protein [Phenylobacterium sp.]
MTTIRSNPFPQTAQPQGQAPVREGAERLASQRAFFAAATGQAAAPASAPTQARAEAPVVNRVAEAPAEPPQKGLRPGSFIDSRV